MDGKLSINTETCIKCGKCARVCPSQIITQETKGSAVKVQNVENCIVCGHCVAVCPTGSVEHGDFPPQKLHRVRALRGSMSYKLGTSFRIPA